jgi:hypothetical protein
MAYDLQLSEQAEADLSTYTKLGNKPYAKNLSFGFENKK